MTERPAITIGRPTFITIKTCVDSYNLVRSSRILELRGIVIAPRMLKLSHLQDKILFESLRNPEEFWARQAEHLHWHKKPKATLEISRHTCVVGITHPTWEWFSGGEISTCYNCVDRHVVAGNGDQVAVYYDSPVTNTKERYTYKQLLHEVETLAGALRQEGVREGDVVMLYSRCASQMPWRAFALI